MRLKSIFPAIIMLYAQNSSAQEIIFSENFENKKIDSAWLSFSGNWRVGDVQELRIAPAENGYQYVLCSGGKGYIGTNMIQLSVDLPDSVKATKIKLSFSYYVLANAPGTKIEGEFYQKEIKDGLRGETWRADLLRKKGRWATFQKILEIPVGANTARVFFHGLESSGKNDRIVCYDNVIISTLP